MRLGQISRKFDLKPQQIREFILNEFNITIVDDPNYKLDDMHVEAIQNAFVSKEENENSTIKPQKLIDIDEIKVTSFVPPINEINENETSITKDTLPELEKSEIDVFTPLPVDPNAELIKAPKIKLEGLKVIGKIELPEKIKIEPEINDENSSDITDSINNDKKIDVDINEQEEEYSIYKDKKGIYHFSQQQRENRIKSLERIKLAKREALRKKKKNIHYEKIAEKTKKKTDKKENKQRASIKNQSTAKPERKGLWGKFLNWLND